jgi:2-polyprenyl-3-methyl-5-hydroxy-6-metoxy-1,4-benzoquinol methylase
MLPLTHPKSASHDLAVSCPLCGGDSTLQFTKQELQYFKCGCDFVFIWPQPSEHELREMYLKQGDEYWATDLMKEFAFSPTKSRREISFVRRFVSGGTLLDIGCSTGSFVKAAREIGLEAEGVDISCPAIRVGRELNLPLHAMDIMRESTGRQYDLVTMWATLEHLPDPRGHLRRAREMLKPGGLLFVSVPNYSGISQKLLGKWDRYVGNGHLNYFTRRVLRQAVEMEGFTFREITTYGFNPIVIAKDLMHRGRPNLATENLLSDQATILRLKESPLLYIQRGVEGILNLCSAGDVVAICAQREG